jgi:prepilin-type N-terminal cleavage/methylation domain-containing protein
MTRTSSQIIGQRVGSAGFTLLELITVMLIISVMVGIASGQFTEYRNRTVPDRAARVVGSYVSLTRSYAVQRRSNVSLAIDPTARTIMIRTDEDTIRTIPFGDGSDFELTVLDTNIDGDSLTFNGRGMCSVCGVGGNAITVTARSTTYLVTFNAIGRWKKTLQ